MIRKSVTLIIFVTGIKYLTVQNLSGNCFLPLLLKKQRAIALNYFKNMNENFCKLSKRIQDRIITGKRLFKSDLAYSIGQVDVYSPMAFCPESFTRKELVEKFNKLFNTNIL